MNSTLHFSGLFHRVSRILVALATGLALQAFAQDEDPPGRVGQINLQQGTVSMSPAGDDTWYDAIANRPITTGDKLWTDRGAHAEVFVGSAAVRMDGQTSVEFSELTDQTLRLTVQQGVLQVRVRDDLAGQQVEVDTGNLAFVVRQPGDYRFLVNPQADTTQVMVAHGAGTVYGDNGEAQEVGGQQQSVFTGRNLEAAGAPVQLSAAFDRWLADRNQVEDQSQSARYVSREVAGYQQLDNYGQWQNDVTYGAVWYPNNVDADWAPYSDGYWTNVAPWGWTWVDRAPWGFAPFHYGRWARFGPRWGWVPGRPQGRPVYSPALVGFVGGRPGTPGGGFSVGSNRPAVGWFPLAPGEAWRPGYRASDRYVDRANRNVLFNNPINVPNPSYANRRVPNGVTAMPADAFGRGPMGRRDYMRPPEQAVAGTAVVNRPPVQWPPMGGTAGAGGAGGAFGFMGRRASSAPAEIAARQQAMPSQQFQQGQHIPPMNDQVMRQRDMLREQRAMQVQGGAGAGVQGQGQGQQAAEQARLQQQQGFQQRAAREQQDYQQRGQEPWAQQRQQGQSLREAQERQGQQMRDGQQQQRQQFLQQQQNQQQQQQQVQMQAQQQQAAQQQAAQQQAAQQQAAQQQAQRAQQEAAQSRIAQAQQQQAAQQQAAQQQQQRAQLEIQQRAQQQNLESQQRAMQAQQQQQAQQRAQQMQQQQQLLNEQQIQRQQQAAQQQQQQNAAQRAAQQQQLQQQQVQQQAEQQARQAHQARQAQQQQLQQQQQQQQLQLQQQQQVQQQRVVPRPPQGPGEPGQFRQRPGGRPDPQQN
ncbi:chromosome partitioning protein ParA [Variovorax sp. J22R133]|uniref:DUF6600 domain-containing protein n=1 Tax=Variovorax brevis TaxID=3053503 RepID=UPI00257793A4|nr:DUF6600 domain-containing protein [Variovorax sp. J22R133]MDM0114718.1 chromosome partitioning protein ParA [Variovorax sp. J22R133]